MISKPWFKSGWPAEPLPTPRRFFAVQALAGKIDRARARSAIPLERSAEVMTALEYLL